MSDAPAAMARRFYDEIINGGNVDLVDELLADDFVEHEEPLPGMTPDRDGVKDFVRAVRTAFPDVRMTPEQILADDERVMIRYRMTGTHEGDFMGVPPTGRKVDLDGYDEARVVGGRAVEHWGAMDGAQLMQQLGALPEAAQTAESRPNTS